jgi:hypothetical protein
VVIFDYNYTGHVISIFGNEIIPSVCSKNTTVIRTANSMILGKNITKYCIYSVIPRKSKAVVDLIRDELFLIK